jgi:predicted HTH transcriptional regulator
MDERDLPSIPHSETVKGERVVIRRLCALDSEDNTTKDIAEGADYSSDTVRNHLDTLNDEGIVSKQGNSHRRLWSSNETIDQVSNTVYLNLPEELM